MEAVLLSMHVVPEAVQDLRSDTSAILPPNNGGPAAGYSKAGAHIFTSVHRLLRKDGFSHVIHAEKFSDNQFNIFFVGNGKKNARLGIVASKKSLPDAVDRNRIKRIIREAFRQHSIKSNPLDMVVMVRRAYAQKPGARVDNLKTLFSRVESRCAES